MINMSNLDLNTNKKESIISLNMKANNKLLNKKRVKKILKLNHKKCKNLEKNHINSITMMLKCSVYKDIPSEKECYL